MAFYLGKRAADDLVVFRSARIPTKATHGHLYAAVIGPFKSKVGAIYFARYGRHNPRIRTAADVERLARADPLMESFIVEESMTAAERAIALECDAQDQMDNTQPKSNIQGAIPCLTGLKTI
jgi:hypothetical protein